MQWLRNRRKPVLTLLRQKPRLSDVRDVDQFTHWLADAISEKGRQEGNRSLLVVVEAGTPDPHLIRVTCHTGDFRVSMTERKGTKDGG